MVALKKLASEQKVSVAELIRKGIDYVIQKRHYMSLTEKRKHAIALSDRFISTEQDSKVSENHDDYLADIYHL